MLLLDINAFKNANSLTDVHSQSKHVTAIGKLQSLHTALDDWFRRGPAHVISHRLANAAALEMSMSDFTFTSWLQAVWPWRKMQSPI